MCQKRADGVSIKGAWRPLLAHIPILNAVLIYPLNKKIKDV